MLIGASLLVLAVIVIFSLVLGGGFIGGVIEMGIDNEAIVDGITQTFVVEPSSIFFNIDTSTLLGALGILIGVLVGMALATGISIAASGLNAQSSRIVILASIYGTLWYLLSVPAYGIIVSIEVFGYLIYIFITITYVVGAIQKITSGGD